jgi:hypothetical protein
MPETRCQKERRRGGRLGGETAHGLSFGTFIPIVFTIRQPPNIVPKPIAPRCTRAALTQMGT